MTGSHDDSLSYFIGGLMDKIEITGEAIEFAETLGAEIVGAMPIEELIVTLDCVTMMLFLKWQNT